MRHTITVMGRRFEVLPARALATETPDGAVLLPHPEGDLFLLICKSCGFGVADVVAEAALEHLISSYILLDHGHQHEPLGFAHLQIDPTYIDHLYEMHNPEVGRA